MEMRSIQRMARPLAENFGEEAGETVGLLARERIERARIEIEHRYELALHDDRHDELAPRRGVARDVAREFLHVRDELHFSGAGTGPTDSACEVDPKTAHRTLIRSDRQ